MNKYLVLMYFTWEINLSCYCIREDYEFQASIYLEPSSVLWEFMGLCGGSKSAEAPGGGWLGGIESPLLIMMNGSRQQVLLRGNGLVRFSFDILTSLRLVCCQ